MTGGTQVIWQSSGVCGISQFTGSGSIQNIHHINIKLQTFARWCVRHLYKPLVTAGNSRTTATLIVFATSAFFHEYLISVPLRLFKVWGFVGMLVQAPLFPVSKFVEKYFGPRFGNVFVWISLILGKNRKIPSFLQIFFKVNLWE